MQGRKEKHFGEVVQWHIWFSTYVTLLKDLSSSPFSLAVHMKGGSFTTGEAMLCLSVYLYHDIVQFWLTAVQELNLGPGRLRHEVCLYNHYATLFSFLPPCPS